MGAAHLAHRDTAVAICAALLLAAAPVACVQAAPPEAPGSSFASDGDGDGDDGSADRASPAAKSQGPLVWLSSEPEASAKSRAERRPLLVRFDTEWCADCKRMAKDTFGDPRVKTQAGRFVAVHIDATNDDDPQVGAALTKYAVINVPTLILVDSSGRERRRFTEVVAPDTLLGAIDKIR